MCSKENTSKQRIAYDEWQKTPITRGMGGFGGRVFSMLQEFPGSASIEDYLRTVDFESTEVKVHWTDKYGGWVRRTFTSRPDNVVVQWLTAPEEQSVNVRITVSERGGGRGFGGGLNTAGVRSREGTGAGSDESGNTLMDFNVQQLTIKGRLDPSMDNRGFANVTRVVRNGGSASMDGATLVIEKASSVMLLTRIEYFPDYSDDKVEAVRQSLEELTPDYPALLERARKVQSEMLNRVTVDFGDASKYGLSSEELLSDQRSSRAIRRFFSRRFRDVPLLVYSISGKYNRIG
jgi:hypothetical protein